MRDSAGGRFDAASSGRDHLVHRLAKFVVECGAINLRDHAIERACRRHMTRRFDEIAEYADRVHAAPNRRCVHRYSGASDDQDHRSTRLAQAQRLLYRAHDLRDHEAVHRNM